MLIAIVLLVAVGWLLIGAVDPDGPPSLLGAAAVGLVLGTLYGHVALIAVWCALGPFSLIRRLPLAAGWLGAIVICLGVNIAHSGPSDGRLIILLVIGAALVAQCILVQTPLWFLAVRRGLCIGDESEGRHAGARDSHQYGIRELIILTTIIAVVLGIGRLALGGITADGATAIHHHAVLFGFLAVSKTLISYPVITAALLPNHRLLGASIAFVLIAAVTAMEVPTLGALSGPGPTWHDVEVLGWMNLVHAFWVLTVLSMLRSAGYQAVTRASSTTASILET